MTENSDSEDGAATGQSYRRDKMIVATIAVLGLAAILYNNWLISVRLWPWASAVWWQGILGFLACCMLVVGPALVIVRLAELPGEQPTSKHLFWFDEANFLTLVLLGVLIYWAFLPSGSWWQGNYWWIWAVVVIVLSIVASSLRMFSVVQKVAARPAPRSFAHEWRFNRGDVNAPPALGLAMSGGGIRSAAFNLGVLQALHQKGVLQTIDVMSAVSGGAYAMSWYLLQPYYAKQVASKNNSQFYVDKVIDEMFALDGRFQTHLRNNPTIVEGTNIGIAALVNATVGQINRAFSTIGDDLDLFNNGGGPRQSYREGIQKLFHTHLDKNAPRKVVNAIGYGLGKDDAITNFTYVTPVKFDELAEFSEANRMPFFIFNSALLVERSCRHMFWPTAFEITADELGSDSCGYRSWADLTKSEGKESQSIRIKKRRLFKWFRAIDSVMTSGEHSRWMQMVNVAPAISGAAIGLSRFDPKKRERAMKLSTWMPFVGNVDLGYLYPRTLLNTDSALYVSDGGHADNLGAYALIRRSCQTIVIVDAEHEAKIPYKFKAYAKLRAQLACEDSLCLDVSDIKTYLDKKPNRMAPLVMTGSVTATNDRSPLERALIVVYIKLGIDKNRIDTYPPSVRKYLNPKKGTEHFPQDSTVNQAYSPEQFSAYTALGCHAGEAAAELLAKTNQRQIEDTSP